MGRFASQRGVPDSFFRQGRGHGGLLPGGAAGSQSEPLAKGGSVRSPLWLRERLRLSAAPALLTPKSRFCAAKKSCKARGDMV